MEPLHGLHRTTTALAGAVLAALTTATYLAVIVQEGNNSFWAALPWVVLMLIGTFAALASAVAPSPRVGLPCAIAATVVLGALGLVAIASVGIGFIVAAALACHAAVSPSSRRRSVS